MITIYKLMQFCENKDFIPADEMKAWLKQFEEDLENIIKTDEFNFESMKDDRVNLICVKERKRFIKEIIGKSEKIEE